VLECVVNVSEGRDHAVLDALAAVCGDALLDRHVDPDHHRAVFTLASPEPGGTEAAARRLTTLAARDLDLREHAGVHPRLGMIDVVPFVALPPTPPDVAVAAAHAFAAWLARTHGVPVFLYDDADPERRSLPVTRRDAFTRRAPDHGPTTPHPALGATAVGARPPLVAINLELDRDALALARAVATAVRERDGGLPGVRALGLALPSRSHSQVSLNVVDLDVAELETVCTAVREHVERAGAHVARVELVGLVPAAALARASESFRAWSGLSEEQTIEARVARAGAGASAATPAAAPEPPA
jgi:glutamate formiminotransferase